ncbi:hypothetical protein DFH09DRAFT_1094232 [Mycena vulgaris]|nr:hypothetical protein DFH09DRAFT_1094232 [Mycena vulgaris]
MTCPREYEVTPPPEPRYISKSAFDPRSPFVGRITATSVPPPHTAESLKRCFAHVEGFVDPEGLLTALSSDSSKREALTRWTDLDVLYPRTSFDGSTPELPYVFVFRGQPSSIAGVDKGEMERSNERDYSGSQMSSEHKPPQKFVKTGKITTRVDSQGWIRVPCGEIVYTGGICQIRTISSLPVNVYWIESAYRKGCESLSYFLIQQGTQLIPAFYTGIRTEGTMFLNEDGGKAGGCSPPRPKSEPQPRAIKLFPNYVYGLLCLPFLFVQVSQDRKSDESALQGTTRKQINATGISASCLIT